MKKFLLFILFCVFLVACKTVDLESYGFKVPQKNSSYFPSEIENCDYFSYDLNKLREPKLYGMSINNLEIYRLTSVSFGGGNRVLTIINNGKTIQKKLTEQKRIKIRNRTSKIALGDFENFKTKLNNYQIEKFKPFIYNNTDDGIQYALEIYTNGKYQIIIRNNPQTGKNGDQKFLEIVNLFYGR